MRSSEALPIQIVAVHSRIRAFKFAHALALAALVAAPATSAAPLDLAQTPLFLTTAVKPNIFFLSDDSGSMDWNLVTPDTDGLLYSVGNQTCVYPYTHPDNGVARRALPPAQNYYIGNINGQQWEVTPTEEALTTAGIGSAPYSGVWRAWNKDYNALYYNPDVDYSPWKGKDANGAAFGNASPSAVPLNPYRPADGTQNLTINQTYSSYYCPAAKAVNVTFYPARYYVWADSNSNGVVDPTDTHTLVEIKSTTPTCASNGTPPCLKRTYADEIQNFANWFTYYRKRDLTMKNAMTKVVAPSTDRLGMSTIHNNAGVGTQIKNVDDITLPLNTTAQTDKATLLARIAQIAPVPGGNTPLRIGLDNVGKYFSGISQTALFGSEPNPLSPILPAAEGGSCQQNFTVLMTDGYYNDSFNAVGNTDADGNSNNALGNTIFDGGAYADTFANTLADVAMRYYEQDLSTLPNEVPVTPGVDEARHQHLVTFGVAFGVNGTLKANPADRTQAFAWPDPGIGGATLEKIDDLRHAAYNGRGEFLNAKSPDELATALSSSLSAIGDRTGSAAAVAVNSRSLNTETALYQARFTSGEWSGDLRALSVNSNGSVGSELWSAKTKLIAQDWDTGRTIVSFDGGAGIPFRWANLSASQKAALKDATDTDDLRGQARLNYLRGDTSNVDKGFLFRSRKDGFKLGDITDSSPIYVGAPPYLAPLENPTHSTFRSTASTRRPMVYVGANDGMLHGFEAATGRERMAYVPNLVFQNLKALTDPLYSHRYYVNGSPTVADAFGAFATCPASSTSCWRTVLVGGLAGGGKGIFALDVTDPEAFTAEAGAAPTALWEYLNVTSPTPGVDPDLGFGYSQPAIGKMQNGAWAAIFGNGYNSANGRAVLYIVDIVTGALIKKIDTTVGTTTTPNGLSTPAAADIDGDYLIDYVYAGDLAGNMWKFDVSGKSTSTWAVAYRASGKPAPLMKAVDNGGNAQPITARPEIGKHPSDPGFMVYFGTGRYVATDDRSPKTVPKYSFYGVWDKSGSNTTVTRADLLIQTLSAGTAANTRTVTDNPIVWRTGASGTACNTTNGTCLGWRVDLPASGEMSVSNPVLLGGSAPRVIFTTLIPESAPCSYGGTSWLMELNTTNGGRPAGGQGLLDTNNDGIIDTQDDQTAIGVNPGVGIMPEPTLIQDSAKDAVYNLVTGSSGAVQSIRNKSPSKPGRRSWRQLK